jgi:regulator of sigma E protease
MEWITNILGFLLVIGVLVAVHEFGHFWVARRVGVKVLRFSIGFGRPLLTRTGKDGTEYVLAAIPLGGYVKMLDEREGPVDPALQSFAFNRKPLWARNAVIVAGPLFNFGLAILAYWAVFIIGALELKPVLGPVTPASPAAEAGLAEGDELKHIGSQTVEAWDQAVMAFLEASDDSPFRVVVARPDGAQVERQMDTRGVRLLDEPGEVLERLGLQVWRPRIVPIVGEVVEDSAAAAAGVRVDDQILSIDGEPTEHWSDLVSAVRARADQSITLAVRRDGQTLTFQTPLKGWGEGDERIGMLGVVPQVPDELFADMRHEVRYGPIAAIPQAINSTWQAGTLTISVLSKMLIGEASVKNLSGPINIAQFAGDSVSLGITPFLKFLAILSISLGILNLLPVPILDGGHLLFNTIEWIKGRPLSEAAQGIGQQIGMGLLLMLMTLAFYNDLHRLFAAGG